VFTARYGLNPYINYIRFVFKRLKKKTVKATHNFTKSATGALLVRSTASCFLLIQGKSC
jgi:hypothetical protein